MYNFDIKHLTKTFFNTYPNRECPELLKKGLRSYDVVVYTLKILQNYYICIPFRSEMKHKNGYRFKFSKRSHNHNSGLDYSKLIIISDKNYIGDKSIIDKDEYIEFMKNEEKIHKQIEKYIVDYINHHNGINVLHKREYDRKYKYSTLKYFHKELGL